MNAQTLAAKIIAAIGNNVNVVAHDDEFKMCHLCITPTFDVTTQNHAAGNNYQGSDFFVNISLRIRDEVDCLDDEEMEQLENGYAYYIQGSAIDWAQEAIQYFNRAATNQAMSNIDMEINNYVSVVILLDDSAKAIEDFHQDLPNLKQFIESLKRDEILGRYRLVFYFKYDKSMGKYLQYSLI